MYSLSKTCGLTGGRVGYLVTPPGVSATFRAAQEATVSCVNTPAQLAAVAAIEGTRTAHSTCGSTSRTVQEEMSPRGQRHSCSPSGWPSPRVPPLDPQAKAGSGAVLPDSRNGS
ncbi:aminotransferase class I/II-fold pyridoxal phosphate-dependent enzyme [Cryobacterium sp. GrIS_2_6]|uniref:aminotransferase class I/II-fold pyridoxal phosphate-dependent enzyme n=1 Tax=Cryobacterium sp. GrIS_2_6 TaxID=3162785 RepID=UPI002E16472B|nr:aminotransferase class I/II-fold pyridoxal phosphate-dependent enzyme [Cryobacterium psychrotolerans]